MLHEFLPLPFGWGYVARFFGYLLVVGVVACGLLSLTVSLSRLVKEWAADNKGGLLLSIVVVLSVVVGFCWILVEQVSIGEPVVALTQGVSIWPTEGIRLLVVLLTGLVLFLARNPIKTHKDIFSEEIFHCLNGTKRGSTSSSGWKEKLMIIGADNPFREGTRRETVDPKRLWQTCLAWDDFRVRVIRNSIIAVKRLMVIGGGNPFREDTGKEIVDPKQLWQTYLDVGSFKFRIIRSLIIAALILCLGGALMIWIDQELPQAPCRGESACLADLTLTIFSVCSLLLLIAFVFDFTRLSKLMIQQLNTGDTDWWLKGQNLINLRVPDYRSKAESDWWDVRFVAEHTASITSLVYFPFIALVLMIVARNPIFDAWHYTLGLVIIFALFGSMSLISAYQLRRAAEQSRARALKNLRDYLAVVIGRDKELEEFIQCRIEDVESIKDGAYASFFQRPEVQTVGLLVAAILQMYVSP